MSLDSAYMTIIILSNVSVTVIILFLRRRGCFL